MVKDIRNLEFIEREEETILSKTFKRYTEEISFLISKAEECKLLINDYDTLTNGRFYNRIKELNIDVSLKPWDYPEIIGLANKKKYNGPVTINTNMRKEVLEEYGHGKDLECKREDRGVNLLIIYTDKNMDFKHRYTKKEIEELLDKEKIVILKRETDWSNKYNFSHDYVPDYDEVFSRSETYEFVEPEGKYYREMLKYMRTKFSKERLQRMFSLLMDKINQEMEVMKQLQKEFKKGDFQKRIGLLQNK